MDFIDRFTEGARRALALSQDSAKEMGHNYVGSEHLLLGLIKEGEGAAARALAQLGIREADVSDRKSTRLNSSHREKSRMPSSA